MTFEEFFKKKRIDLIALEKGEPALLFEFKTHFEQMGEKSFDHTKKYWFNKLRLQYHLAPEIKTEKPHIENQLAEQTITDSLTEAATTPPKVGFTPRFKAPVAAKPVEETTSAEEDKEAVSSAPKPGFTPRFKPGMTKPAEVSIEQPEEKKEEIPAAPKPGFTPRFKAANMAKPAEATPAIEEKAAEETPTPAEPKLGFKPKFRQSAPPKSEEE
jgi:hypothetical protein